MVLGSGAIPHRRRQLAEEALGRAEAHGRQPDHHVDRRVRLQLRVQERGPLSVAEIRAHVAQQRHRDRPVEVLGDIVEVAGGELLELVSGIVQPALFAQQRGQRRAPGRATRVVVDQLPGGVFELAHPALFAPDPEHLDRVVLRRGDRLRRRAGGERLRGQHVRAVELARQQRGHRPPHDRAPLVQGLAEPVGTGVERLDLSGDRVAVTAFEQVDDEPRVRLEL